MKESFKDEVEELTKEIKQLHEEIDTQIKREKEEIVKFDDKKKELEELLKKAETEGRQKIESVILINKFPSITRDKLAYFLG